MITNSFQKLAFYTIPSHSQFCLNLTLLKHISDDFILFFKNAKIRDGSKRKHQIVSVFLRHNKEGLLLGILAVKGRIQLWVGSTRSLALIKTIARF